MISGQQTQKASRRGYRKYCGSITHRMTNGAFVLSDQSFKKLQQIADAHSEIWSMLLPEPGRCSLTGAVEFSIDYHLAEVLKDLRSAKADWIEDQIELAQRSVA